MPSQDDYFHVAVNVGLPLAPSMDADGHVAENVGLPLNPSRDDSVAVAENVTPMKRFIGWGVPIK